MILSRRRLLICSPIAIMAGCTSTTTNGNTVLNINLATANAYATAIENGANMLLAIPVISAAMGPANVAIVGDAIKGIASAIATLNTVYKGQVSFDFTIATEPAALTALLTDANQINGVASAVVSSLGTQLSQAEQETIDAIQTIVSTLVALATGTVGMARLMTPAVALTVLGVK